MGLKTFFWSIVSVHVFINSCAPFCKAHCVLDLARDQAPKKIHYFVLFVLLRKSTTHTSVFTIAEIRIQGTQSLEGIVNMK